MLCRATQDGWVMVESSDKMWPTGEGNGKHFFSFPQKKKCEKAKWLSEEALQIAVKRSKSKGEEERYTHLTEKAMAPHSSTLAWKIPWMEEPGRLQSMGSQRVRHD